MCVSIPMLGWEMDNTTAIVSAMLGLALVYFYVMGKMRPRAIKYPRSRFVTRKAIEVRVCCLAWLVLWGCACVCLRQ